MHCDAKGATVFALPLPSKMMPRRRREDALDVAPTRSLSVRPSDRLICSCHIALSSGVVAEADAEKGSAPFAHLRLPSYFFQCRRRHQDTDENEVQRRREVADELRDECQSSWRCEEGREEDRRERRGSIWPSWTVGGLCGDAGPRSACRPRWAAVTTAHRAPRVRCTPRRRSHKLRRKGAAVRRWKASFREVGRRAGVAAGRERRRGWILRC